MGAVTEGEEFDMSTGCIRQCLVGMEESMEEPLELVEIKRMVDVGGRKKARAVQPDAEMHGFGGEQRDRISIGTDLADSFFFLF